MDSYFNNNFYIFVTAILFAFALAGEWRATTQVTDAAKKYSANTDTVIHSADAGLKCNNYLYTQEFVQFVNVTADVQWRRSILISVFTMLLVIPFSGSQFSDWPVKTIVTFLFVNFVVCWLIMGYNSYHMKNVADISIQNTMGNSANLFDGTAAQCTYVPHFSFN